MKPIDIILVIIIALVLAFAVISIIRRRKRGGACCNCPGASTCGRAKASGCDGEDMVR
ncbi:MAG: FeoB-associated Cys-rich membrane protein [Lachnospiraceae bacterium]|nr:FeoB-associated Cys-rich membrane protein [Lachnospiraceae bacterium]